MEPELTICHFPLEGFNLDDYTGRQELYLSLAVTIQKAIHAEPSPRALCFLEDALGNLEQAAEEEASARRAYESDLKAGVA